MTDNYFNGLYAIDVSDKVKQKNGLNYLPWAVAWAEIKKMYPDANYTVYEDESGRFWWDDDRTGWVKVGVVINNIEHIERLAVMNFKNSSIPADQITSTDANKALQRALTKACGRHGLGLRLYEGEDIVEEAKQQKAKQKTEDQIKQETKLKDTHKKIIELCNKKIEEGVNKEVLYQAIADNNNGNKNPNAIKDIEIADKVLKLINKMEVTKHE